MAGVVTATALVAFVLMQVSGTRPEITLDIDDVGLLNSVAMRMVNTIPTHAFQSYVASSRKTSVLYFYKKDMSNLGSVLRYFDNAKKEKKLRNSAQFAKVNCTKDPGIPFCSVEKSHHYVYIVRQTVVKAAVPISDITEVDALVGRVFQVQLDKSLKKIKTKTKLVDLQTSSAGQEDIIVSYQMKGRPFERRVFLDYAMDNHKLYKFAVTTKQEVSRILSGGRTPRIPTVWYLHCTEEKKGSETCRSTAYRGLLTPSGLVNFIKAMKLPHVLTVSEQTLTTCRTLGLHAIHVFTNTEKRSESSEMAENLGTSYQGTAGVLLTNLDKISMSRLKALGVNMKKDVEIPAVAVQRNGHEDLHFIGGFPYKDILEYVETYMAYYEELQVQKEIQRKKRRTDTYGQSDVVAVAVNKDRVVGREMKHISTLTDKTFPTLLAEEHLVIVVFHLSWDVRSKAFMYSYSEASKMLTDTQCNVTLAHVACDDWTDVCKLNNITAYPTTRVYVGGAFLKDYKGMLDTTEFVNFVKLLQIPVPIELKSAEDTAAFIAGTVPELLRNATHASVVGAFKSGNDKEFKIFTQASRHLHGYHVLGAVTDGKLAAEVCLQFEAEVPCVVVVKRNDGYQQHRVLREDVMDVEALVNFVEVASLPLFPKLTSRNFPALYRQRKPFVILFGGSARDLKAVGQIAASEQINAVFSWMDLYDPDRFAVELLDFYASSTDIPALIIVDHATGNICHYSQCGNFVMDDIKSWIQDCTDDSVEKTGVGKLVEGKWKPVSAARDFLSLLDAKGDCAKQLEHPRSALDDADDEEMDRPDDYHTGHAERKTNDGKQGKDEQKPQQNQKHTKDTEEEKHTKEKQKSDEKKKEKENQKKYEEKQSNTKDENTGIPRDEL